MSVHARAHGSRAGDTLWQCLNEVSTPAWDPLALFPRPSPPMLGISLEHPAPAGPHSTCSGNRGAPVPPSTPVVRAAPSWHSLWERGRSQGRVQSLQERAVNHQGHNWLLLRCSREKARPCGDSLDALRGIPQAENPAGSSKLLPISADSSSCLARQVPFPGSVPSLCVRGAARWQEALGTSSSSSRKSSSP